MNAGCLHVYCSGQPTFPVYNATVPFPADVVEINTIDPALGYWDAVNHRYVTLAAQIVQFHGNVCRQ